MNPLLWVSFAYTLAPGAEWHFGNHKILHPEPVCDQPYVVHIEELLRNIYSAGQLKLISWRRFEEP